MFAIMFSIYDIRGINVQANIKCSKAINVIQISINCRWLGIGIMQEDKFLRFVLFHSILDLLLLWAVFVFCSFIFIYIYILFYSFIWEDLVISECQLIWDVLSLASITFSQFFFFFFLIINFWKC